MGEGGGGRKNLNLLGGGRVEGGGVKLAVQIQAGCFHREKCHRCCLNSLPFIRYREVVFFLSFFPHNRAIAHFIQRSP